MIAIKGELGHSLVTAVFCELGHTFFHVKITIKKD